MWPMLARKFEISAFAFFQFNVEFLVWGKVIRRENLRPI
jgi:hypothetical protein